MDKKLTLSLDREVIEWAKGFAKEQGVSLSKMFQRHLQELRNQQLASADTTNQFELTPLVKELLGSVPNSGPTDVRNARYEYLDEKFERN